MSEPESESGAPSGAAAGGDGGPRRREPWLRFALSFSALAIASEVLYYAIALDSRAFEAYLRVLARISGSVIRLFAADLEIRGTLLSNHSFSVEIAQGCDAIEVCALLSAAVIAFPVGMKQKLRGLALGILVLQLLNLIRIITLFWVGAEFTSLFETVHKVVWPAFLIAVTVGMWIFWVKWEIRTAPPAA